MSATEILKAAKALPPEERIKLARDMWEIVTPEGYGPDLTSEQMAELDRRAEEALNNPGKGTPIEEVSAEIRKQVLAKK